MATAGFSPFQAATLQDGQGRGLLAALTVRNTFLELQHLDAASAASSRGLFRSASEPTLCVPQSDFVGPSPTALSHEFDSSSELCTDTDTVSPCEDEIVDEESEQQAPSLAAEPCVAKVPAPPPAVDASIADVFNSYHDPFVQLGEWTATWALGGAATAEQGCSHDQFSDPSWAEMDFRTAMHAAFHWGQAHGMSVASDLASQHHTRPVEPSSTLHRLRQTGASVQRRLASHVEPERDEDEEGQSGSEGNATGASRARCQVIWCDQSAFKSASAPLKASLEARVGQPVKAHKSADKCLRFLRKKKHVQGRPPCVFLLSYSNARALLENFEDVKHLAKAVVVLGDAARNTVPEVQAKLADMFAETTVASSWDEAVAAVQAAVRSTSVPIVD